jgi:calcium-dependent protein kinase
MIDTDNSGTITFEELKHGLKRVGSQMTETEIKDLMDAVNTYKELDKEKKKIFL